MNYSDKTDLYISKSADFAKPVLERFRRMVHEVCPEVEETIKWGFPHFEYKGILASMAAFKEHCSITFWKASLMPDKPSALKIVERDGMGHLGKIQSLDDLPGEDTLKHLILQARVINEKGMKKPVSRKEPKKEIDMPDDLGRALEENEEALVFYQSLSASAKREYLEWVTEAKSEDTRRKRLETTVQWLSEKKKRNWKYEK